MLDDLCATDDRDIDARLVGPVPRLTLGLMKHYKSREVLVFLAQHADDVRTLHATEHGRLWLFYLMRYIGYVHPDIDRATLISLLTSLLGKEFEQTMVTFDELIVQRFGAEATEAVYQNALKKGIEQGIEKGIERQRTILLHQLGRRFGAVPEAIAERVARAGAEDLDRWCECIIDASSLDELFAAA